MGLTDVAISGPLLLADAVALLVVHSVSAASASELALRLRRPILHFGSGSGSKPATSRSRRSALGRPRLIPAPSPYPASAPDYFAGPPPGTSRGTGSYPGSYPLGLLGATPVLSDGLRRRRAACEPRTMTSSESSRDAVVVGIDRYPGAPLTACVNDAREMETALALEQYGFDCKRLFDSQATRPAILDALSELAYRGTQGDMLLFYFAGHGRVIGHTAHIVTVDGKPFDPGISLAQLAQIMESANHDYQHVIAILDCCHSGSAFNWVNSRPLQSNDIEREVRAVNESRCILAACRPEEPALELSELRHGVFTDKLIDGMLGSAVDFDGQVSLLSLFEFVSRAIPGYVQTPVFKGDIAGTVVLGRGFEPRRGQPIDKAETKATLAKAQRLVDEYHNLRQRELIDAVHKSREGWRTCSLELESVHNWFNSTLTALPDIARESVWTRLDTQLRD